MSSRIWTAAELKSKKTSLKGACWRIVEAQHFSSTMKLVGSAVKQEILEAEIEKTKPEYPAELEGYHWCLVAPFRYAPYPHGSRFRRAGNTDAVYYASENVETALAERAFYQLLFYSESPETDVPVNAADHTAFSIKYGTSNGIDITQKPYSNNNKRLLDLLDYSFCQSVADECRAAGIDVIRSISVRCPKNGKNISLLSHACLKSKQPESHETWKITIKKEEIIANKNFSTEKLLFPTSFFASDPRIADKLKAWK